MAIVLSFAALLASLGVQGEQGRRFLASPSTVTVRSPAEAARVWAGAGVRGRVLLLFDRYPHFSSYYQDFRTAGPQPGTSFVQLAVFTNEVRRVYLVVPGALWQDFWRQRALYGAFGSVPGAWSALYLHNSVGVPFVATVPEALPELREPALVYVNPHLFDPGEVAALLAAKGIRSDLTVVLDPGSAR